MKKLKMIALLLLSSCATPLDYKKEDKKCEEHCGDEIHYYIAYQKKCICLTGQYRDV